jgi:hypothetical protein
VSSTKGDGKHQPVGSLLDLLDIDNSVQGGAMDLNLTVNSGWTGFYNNTTADSLYPMDELGDGGEDEGYGYYPPIKQPPYMILVLSLAYLLIFLCALVGNVMVVVVVVRTPRMHNVTNYLIANLALADILVAIFCIPLTLLANIYSGK